jgi:tetratricopeptide (TPR) repeat protein
MKQSWLVVLVLALSSGALSAQDYKTYDEGVAQFKAKEYTTVIESFSKLINDGEKNKKIEEDLYFFRGQSYFHTGDYHKGIDDLDKALNLNHYNKGLLYWYKARCYDKLAKPDEAARNYQTALKEAERNKKLSSQILADHAEYLSRQGDLAGAQADLARAKELDPTNKQLESIVLANNTATRNAGDKKSSQLIIKNNPPKDPPKEKETKSTPQSQQPQNSNPQNTEPVTSSTSPATVKTIADAYKAEKRYALIIGNSNYSKDLGMLKNPVNDATDIATELRQSDFEVQLLTNATYIQIREAVRKFHEKLTNGPKDQTVGLFYYAGHGVQYQDENYLVPIDAQVQFEDDIVRMCFPVQRMVLANMERSNSRMNIVILDACRNNPFPAVSRSLGNSGLAEMKRARGSFIAYATAPGSVASDGTGRNGLYTQELLKALRKPGLTIEQVFKDVRVNVLRLSGDKQFTWDSSNIVGEFYFKL